MAMRRANRKACRLSLAVIAAALPALAVAPSHAAALPEIRTSLANPVPACVTPDRLMAFLKGRNSALPSRYKDIARHYKTFGEAWRVRWDYAFYQMAVETNFLSFRQPNGRMGDVDPAQNNFAGIGTTGGGVPGDAFPDVKTGVHAQIQHLVVYSGERLAAPIAPRTQLKQDDILKASLELNRPVRFNDLARRWAVDRNYDKSIEWVAGMYRSRYCTGRQAEAAPAPQPVAQPARMATAEPVSPAPKRASSSGHPAVRTIWTRDGGHAPSAKAQVPTTPTPGVEAVAVAAPASSVANGPSKLVLTAATAGEENSNTEADPAQAATSTAPASAFDPAKTPPAGLGAGALSCSISTASYGGTRSVLIKAPDGDNVRYTALSVIAGFERSMTDNFIKARAPKGAAIGEFDTREAALDMARTLCPSAGP
jgi:hypothetical protein